MPLTPEDVSNKRFTPVRLREGYDMGEVDQFLDEVESELSRLTRENEELRGRLSAVQEGETADASAAASTAEADRAEAPPGEQVPAPASPEVREPEAEEAPVQVEAAPVTAADETFRVTTAAEASTAATRLLEIATRSADELVAEARAEATQLLGEARSDAEQRETESKERAERIESDARSRSQMLDAETEERRRQLLGDLQREREKLSGDVESLRAFEREYRSRLKSYFEQQLAALDQTGSVEDEGHGEDDHAPRRLRSLLTGHDDQPQNS